MLSCYLILHHSTITLQHTTFYFVRSIASTAGANLLCSGFDPFECERLLPSCSASSRFTVRENRHICCGWESGMHL